MLTLYDSMLWVLLLPLMGSIFAGLMPRRLSPSFAHYVTISTIGISFLLSVVIAKWFLWDGRPPEEDLFYTWGSAVSFQFHLGFLLDNLSALMLVIVSGISLLVHIYSIGYMDGDPGYSRFFSYISFFTFSMLLLVVADNFLQLFLGWEGVGLASYLLIGFWFNKESANEASLKAFLVNRVGDLGFLLGMAVILSYVGTLNYAPVFSQAPLLVREMIPITSQVAWSVNTVICILLFIGAMGKSAQMPLHVWLPDSMEGPTPISALIHAATMVTAGIYMVCRMSPLFEYSPAALSLMLVVGATTALFTGILALVQNDIKRIIAYSTLSQLGYMVAALGASAYAASIFHLATHACFKALLFLAAGSVIIALHHEQNIQKMGNLRRFLPITYISFLIGALALSALPPFSGFYSKTAIIEWVHGTHILGGRYAYFCLLFATFFTALYTFRLFFLVFYTSERFDPHIRNSLHEPRWVMWAPTLILAIPSILLGFFLDASMFKFEGNGLLGEAIKILPIHELHEKHISAIQLLFDSWYHPAMWLTLAGIFAAWLAVVEYPAIAEAFIHHFSWTYKILKAKYGFDKLYQLVFVKGGKKLADNLFYIADVRWLDNYIINGTGKLITKFSAKLRCLQSGYLYHYAFAMILGVLLFLAWSFWQVMR